jgi:hypothetical protein
MNLESELFAFPVSVRVRRLFSVVQVELKSLSRAPAVVAGQMLKVRVSSWSWVCSKVAQGKRTGTITSCTVIHRRYRHSRRVVSHWLRQWLHRV